MELVFMLVCVAALGAALYLAIKKWQGKKGGK